MPDNDEFHTRPDPPALSEAGRGWLLMGAGLFFLGLAYLNQIIRFSRHVPAHSLSPRSWALIAMSPMFFFLGAAYIALGSRAVPMLGRPKQPTIRGWVLYIVAVGVGIMLAIWIDRRLKV